MEPQKAELLPGLAVLAQAQTTTFQASMYEPVLCLILQGRKETTFGGETFETAAGDCLLVSHELPVTARVLTVPYLALLMPVDVQILRGLYEELADMPLLEDAARAIEVHRASDTLLGAIERYLALADAPADARVLGPLLRKELHYRVLTAPFGGMLRRLVRHDSHASAIARALAQIRRDYRGDIAIPELARSVGMSTSSFHKHFKAVTSASPLQYQKDLRLLSARARLREGEASVSDVAFENGYESASQFSREYARKFGVPPSKDATRV